MDLLIFFLVLKWLLEDFHLWLLEETERMLSAFPVLLEKGFSHKKVLCASMCDVIVKYSLKACTALVASSLSETFDTPSCLTCQRRLNQPLAKMFNGTKIT